MNEGTVGSVAKETCNVLWIAVKKEGFVNVPQTCDNGKNLAKDLKIGGICH